MSMNVATYADLLVMVADMKRDIERLVETNSELTAKNEQLKLEISWLRKYAEQAERTANTLAAARHDL